MDILDFESKIMLGIDTFMGLQLIVTNLSAINSSPYVTVSRLTMEVLYKSNIDLEEVQP